MLLLSKQTKRLTINSPANLTFYNYCLSHFSASILNIGEIVIDKDNEKNKNLDKFYTKPKVVKYCVNIFTANFPIQKQDSIIEPDAGDVISARFKFNWKKWKNVKTG
jgi:hypothetical protein